ncbi:MAG: hypothetical protein ACTSQC_07985 [Candidatus Heimdallarchaeaceae archaeon]
MTWYTVLLIVFLFIALIITITFRIYYKTYSKEKKSLKHMEDPDEIKRRETFRQMVHNFVQKY